MYLFRRRLTVICGLLLPLAETIRRWSTWREYPSALIDDYLIGAFLLYGAWRNRRNIRDGQRFLVGGLGLRMCDGLQSFFGHWRNVQAADRAPVSYVRVIVIIGVGWALALISLAASLQRLPGGGEADRW